MWCDTCTRCGRRLHSSSALRKWGAVYLVLGLGLCGVISYIAWVVAGIMLHSGDPGATMRFSGTRLHAVMIFGVFSVVFLIGLTLVAGGVWQLAYGRKNHGVTKVALVWFALIWAAYAILVALELVESISR